MILKEDELELETKKCNFCHSNFNNQKKVYSAQELPIVDYYFCSDCYVSFSNRQPKDIALEKIYNPVNYTSKLTSSDDLTVKLAKRIAKQISIKKNNLKVIRVLDFGGGNGNLSKKISSELLKLGYESKCTVIDIHNSIDKDDNIKFVKAKEMNKIKNKFDLVLASAVLEHLKSPKATLDKLIQLTEKGGFFYARTPWDGPLAKFIPNYKLRWPQHLFDMGGDFWNKYLTMHNKNKITIIWFRPSIIETSIRNFFKFNAAFVLKSIAVIELFLRNLFSKKNPSKIPYFKLVGGWEVLIQIK